jgi:putative DNA methylase
MTALVTVNKKIATGLAPLSLKDAPAFIEAQFPVGRLSAEAYKERKAGSSQTLTSLGSYWKGRKPLILVRAVVLGSLLPATDDPSMDLDIFLKLMAMSDSAFGRRFEGSATEFARLFPAYAELVTEVVGRRLIWRETLNEQAREAAISETFATLPYSFDQRLKHVRRPEECDEAVLLRDIWSEVNRHLGTQAWSLVELVKQLGIARFGHQPKLADTFCGGGSIPFEAARLGCDVYASDLNPVACMLTWGAFNIIGASAEKRGKIEKAQKQVAAAVDAEITRLGIEHDEYGNRAKAFLYCLETRCPKTGWMVPMAPNWVISKTRRVVAKLLPNHTEKRYDIEILEGASSAEMADAEMGTVRAGRLIHPMNPERSGVEIKTIRGDYRDAEGNSRNRLRLWEKTDFEPRPNDVYQERLYCIQWITKESLDKNRHKTFFNAVTEGDLVRERKVAAIVGENLSRWQERGFTPDMEILTGKENEGPIRTNGWCFWHHLFPPRALLWASLFSQNLQNTSEIPAMRLVLAKALDWSGRLTKWDSSAGSDKITNVFSSQGLKTFFGYAVRGHLYAENNTNEPFVSRELGGLKHVIETKNASEMTDAHDLGITDPPYADAVRYEEITEFFIAWLRKNPPSPFDQWTWDSQRSLAIKGKDESFRRDMVAAYSAMTRSMPYNGLQVVMFTHQDAGVWADLGAILWAAGLRVTAAWNIVTETESALKEGNYVQGTVCLVLRKRLKEANARRMEIEAEVEEAVASQLSRLNALDESWHERTNAETLYTDGDLTLAAYAAALQVVTAYSTIDRQPLDRDLYRKLGKGERTMIRDLVDYAAQVANGVLVPAGFPRDMWRDLAAPERFYVRMLDMESKGAAKVADFQNFAKSFAFGDYTSVMASTTANAASLAGAADFKGSKLGGEGFFATQLRQVLFAVWKTLEKSDPKLGVVTLRTEYAADYWQRRQKLIALAAYIAAKTKHTRANESAAAHELAEALKLDRV